MGNRLEGQPSFDEKRPDQASFVEGGSDSAEPVCIRQGAKEGLVEAGAKCLVNQCAFVCNGPEISPSGVCIRFAGDLGKLAGRL